MSVQGKEGVIRTSRGMSIKEMEGRVSAVLLGWWNESRGEYKRAMKYAEEQKKADKKVVLEPQLPRLNVAWDVYEWSPGGTLASAHIAGTSAYADGDQIQNTISEIASSAVAIAVGDARGHVEPLTYIFTTRALSDHWNTPMITRTTLLVDVEKL